MLSNVTVTQVQSKWSKLLDPAVANTLLSNMNQWLKDTTSAISTPFTKFALPLVRRSAPQLVTQNIVSVQPMTSPVGSVFYKQFRKLLGTEFWTAIKTTFSASRATMVGYYQFVEHGLYKEIPVKDLHRPDIKISAVVVGMEFHNRDNLYAVYNIHGDRWLKAWYKPILGNMMEICGNPIAPPEKLDNIGEITMALYDHLASA